MIIKPGMTIEAKYKGSKRYFLGAVLRHNADSTFSIKFDLGGARGEIVNNVPRKDIRLPDSTKDEFEISHLIFDGPISKLSNKLANAKRKGRKMNLLLSSQDLVPRYAPRDKIAAAQQSFGSGESSSRLKNNDPSFTSSSSVTSLIQQWPKDNYLINSTAAGEKSYNHFDSLNQNSPLRFALRSSMSFSDRPVSLKNIQEQPKECENNHGLGSINELGKHQHHNDDEKDHFLHFGSSGGGGEQLSFDSSIGLPHRVHSSNSVVSETPTLNSYYSDISMNTVASSKSGLNELINNSHALNSYELEQRNSTDTSILRRAGVLACARAAVATSRLSDASPVAKARAEKSKMLKSFGSSSSIGSTSSSSSSSTSSSTSSSSSTRLSPSNSGTSYSSKMLFNGTIGGRNAFLMSSAP